MSADTSSQNVSKEKALAEYLKKCSDPAYTSKVIGGGIIFKKAQSKDSWKKRTYFVKDDKKLLYFYYGGKAKPPLGMLDVTSALLSTGPADNIKKSGATKTEAISLNVSFANEPADSNNKHFVFENSSEAKKFALMLCYCSKNTNVMVRNLVALYHFFVCDDWFPTCTGLFSNDGVARLGGSMWW